MAFKKENLINFENNSRMLDSSSSKSFRRPQRFGEVIRFAKTFAKSPRKIGALMPSSENLAWAMVDKLDWENIKTVIEYGSGTGAITKGILAKINESHQFIAIEANKKFAELFSARYPKVNLHVNSVGNIGAICKTEGISKVDCIISSLPWAAFSKKDQEKYLSATIDILDQDSSFTTFCYLQSLATPAGIRFISSLKYNFSEVKQTAVVWKNVPPAAVIRCCGLKVLN